MESFQLQDDDKEFSIHQIWLQGEDQIPQRYHSNIASWRALGFPHKIWDSQEIRRSIEIHFPLLLPIFDRYPVFVQKADLGRYIILYLYGGLYVDMDTRPKITARKKWRRFFKSIPDHAVVCPLAEVYTGFFPLNSKVRNWFIYVPRKKNAFLAEILKQISHHAERKWYHLRSYYVAWSTGSRLITKISLDDPLMRRHLHANKKVYRFVETSYDSSWGGWQHLDKQDITLILTIIVILGILLCIIWKVKKSFKKSKSYRLAQN